MNKKVSTIHFFIEAAEYHYKNLKTESEGAGRPKINEEGFKKMLGNHKGMEIGVPITMYFEKGYAVTLYEFYSFVSVVIAAVNNIVDLKCRAKDGYSKDFSFSFGSYMVKKNRKKLPNFEESPAHDLIIKNADWIREIKKIRDKVHHRPIQELVLAHLIMKGEKDKSGNIIDKSTVKQYVPLRKELKEIFEYCDEVLENLENFWKEMKKVLSIKEVDK